MDLIIRKDNLDYYIFIKKENNKYIFSGYDSNKKPIDNSIFNFFSFLKLSNNNIKLNSNKIYDIYRDLDTNLIHFFKDGNDNLKLLLSYNARNFMFYSKNGNNNKEQKKSMAKKLSFLGFELILLSIISFEALSFFNVSSNINDVINNINASVHNSTYFVNNSNLFITESVTIEDIVKYINSSENLKSFEKEFLINMNFFNDMLPFINDGKLSNVLYSRLKDLSINYYDKETRPGVAGYYSGGNDLYVGNYNSFNFNYYKDTVAHEFMHLFQYSLNEDYIIEALAEILSFEYYDVPINSYGDEVTNIKLLIDIVGRDTLLEYSANRDITLIDNILADYLSENEIKLFNKIVIDYDPLEENGVPIEHHTMRELIKKAYYNKTGKYFDEEYIKNINNPDRSMRYFFNSVYVNDSEYNYYSIEEKEYYSLKQAYDMGKITILQKEVQLYDYYDYKENHSKEYIDYKNILEHIVLLKNNIEILFLLDDGYVDWDLNTFLPSCDEIYLIVKINNEHKSMSIDDLIKEGYIEYKVPCVDYRDISYAMYEKLNKEEKKDIVISSISTEFFVTKIEDKYLVYTINYSYIPIHNNNLSK